ncbi:hypothetical protein CERSUDRAFT_51862, partial [Gelatoporia subvermispora B]
LTDKNGMVFAVFVGRPQGDSSWAGLFEEVGLKMKEFGPRVGKKYTRHSRGVFPLLSTGFSFGGGRKQPMNVAHSPRKRAMLDELCSLPAMQRLAGFARSAFAFYMPKLHRAYVDCVTSLEGHDSMLRCPFHHSPFPSASFNFGPRAVSYEHRDVANLADGVCALYAGGRFNYCKGGHMVFRALGLTVQFPATTLASIPSGSLLHGNVDIQTGEERWAFTQYAAGELFRYVECNYKTCTELSEEDPEFLC